MKNIIFMVLFLVMPILIFAEENANSSESLQPLDCYMFLQYESFGIYNNSQLTLTPYANISRGGAFAFNLLIGFGLGSFLQGDKLGGILGVSRKNWKQNISVYKTLGIQVS